MEELLTIQKNLCIHVTGVVVKTNSVCQRQWRQVSKPGFFETSNNRVIVCWSDVNRYSIAAETECR